MTAATEKLRAVTEINFEAKKVIASTHKRDK